MYTVEFSACAYDYVYLCVLFFLYVRAQLIRLICILFNEPCGAVPGQDEQLLSDWSVTWWWTGGVGGGGGFRMFFHMKDQLSTSHLPYSNYSFFNIPSSLRVLLDHTLFVLLMQTVT